MRTVLGPHGQALADLLDALDRQRYGGATPGTYFRDGVKLAVAEINAAGGIMGKKLQTTDMDTQTNPGVAKGLAEVLVAGREVGIGLGHVHEAADADEDLLGARAHRAADGGRAGRWGCRLVLLQGCY